MTRIVRICLLAVPALALLGGCVLDPFGLPPLGAGGGASTSARAPYYGYGSGYGAYDPRFGYYGPGYGYSTYRYDPLLGYATPGYAYYYGPGYRHYRPYPYPYGRGPYCVDANRDGRCDTRPPRHDDGQAGGGGSGDGNAGGGPNTGRDDLGRNPIRRLRDIDRSAPAGAGRAPVTAAPLQQVPPTRPPGASPPAARPPAASPPAPRGPAARPERTPGDPPRSRPADGPRIRDLDLPPPRSSRDPVTRPNPVER